MLPFMLDTPAQQQRQYYAMLRRQRPEARALRVFALTEAVRRIAVAGIRDRHPEASEEEVRARLAVRLYGRKLAERLFDSIPADAR